MTNHKPAKVNLPILTQLCKLIPSHLTASLTKKHGIDKQARTFSAWSHVVSLLFAQLTRAKDNMAYTVRKKLLKKPAGKILRDDLILLKGAKSRSQYPETFRRVEMLVEVDGKEVVMAFITNNTEWAASSVGELYQARFQATQANPPDLRLPRPQQGGDPLAALGGIVALRADALAGAGGGLGAQLLAVAGSSQGRGVGSDRSCGTAAILWDSGRRLADAKLLRRHVSAGIFAIKPWDSTWHQSRRNQPSRKQSQKTESPTKPSILHTTSITTRHSGGYGMTVDSKTKALFASGISPMIPHGLSQQEKP